MLHQLRFCVSIYTSARAVRLWVSARPRPSLLVQLQQSQKHPPRQLPSGPLWDYCLGKGEACDTNDLRIWTQRSSSAPVRAGPSPRGLDLRHKQEADREGERCYRLGYIGQQEPWRLRRSQSTASFFSLSPSLCPSPSVLGSPTSLHSDQRFQPKQMLGP